MPKKSFMEMTKLQRMRYSLSSRIFRFVILGAVLLGVVSLIIELSLYTIQYSKQLTPTLVNLSATRSSLTI